MTDYADDDLVYFDPARKLIVGKVEFGKNGNALKKEMEIVAAPASAAAAEEEDEGADKAAKGKRKGGFTKRKRFYPWGTFKSARKLYSIGGKFSVPETVRPFDDALRLSLEQPYWDDPVAGDATVVKQKEAETY